MMNRLRYIPSSAAPELIAALWRLAVPNPVVGGTRGFGSQVRDLEGGLWLEIDVMESINVHPNAVLDGIADILQPWIDQGHLAADTNTVLAALVESLRGQRLVVYDAFPDLFKQMSKSHEDMISEGKLAAPQTP